MVAHSISVMVLQARGGRRVLESEPDDAREAFAVIESTGQQALDEMRRLVGMLRNGDEAVALARSRVLKELGRLVEQVQAAGLPVQVVVEGEPRDLPPGVDLSAFRIAGGADQRPSRTPALRALESCSDTTRTTSSSRSQTTAPARTTVPAPVTASSGCASASPSTVASCRRGGGPGGGFAPASAYRSDRRGRDDPRPARG